MSLEKYIKEQNNSNFSLSGIQVSILDPLITKSDLNFRYIVSKAASLIPSHLMYDVDKIVFGPNDIFKKRDLQGLYRKGVVYLSGNQDTEGEVLDDLIHEISHSIEDRYNDIIYSDGLLEREFLTKRRQLKTKLSKFKIDKRMFDNPEYDIKFDKVLYKQVGYDFLTAVSSNIFFSPYAATSLREYFANGFEAFYMREEVEKLKKVSPVLYTKIVELNNIDKKEKNR